MQKFAGFPDGSKLSPTAFPALFFTELLPLIDNLAELKVTLFCFWALHQKEGRFRYLRQSEFQNPVLLDGLRAACPDAPVETALADGLARTIERGTLLTAQVELESTTETLFFVNTALGRLAVAQVAAGAWKPGGECIEILPERPNIYRLYEANIGMLTPMIRDALVDAESEYPVEWIESAIREAAERNKPSWRYIQSILKRWEREGRSREPGRPAGQDGKHYVSGQFADFIEH